MTAPLHGSLAAKAREGKYVGYVLPAQRAVHGILVQINRPPATPAGQPETCKVTQGKMEMERWHCLRLTGSDGKTSARGVPPKARHQLEELAGSCKDSWTTERCFTCTQKWIKILIIILMWLESRYFFTYFSTLLLLLLVFPPRRLLCKTCACCLQWPTRSCAPACLRRLGRDRCALRPRGPLRNGRELAYAEESLTLIMTVPRVIFNWVLLCPDRSVFFN